MAGQKGMFSHVPFLLHPSAFYPAALFSYSIWPIWSLSMNLHGQECPFFLPPRAVSRPYFFFCRCRFFSCVTVHLESSAVR